MMTAMPRYTYSGVRSIPSSCLIKLTKLKGSLSYLTLVAFFFSPLEALFSCSDLDVSESNFSPLSNRFCKLFLTPVAISCSSTSIFSSFLYDSSSCCLSSSSSKSYGFFFLGFELAMACSRH